MSNIKTILYAEDDLDIQTITMIILEEKYEVIPCVNGQELLDKVDAVSPDLILLDVMMPVMDGVTAYLELKKSEKTKDIPVIFITAKVNKKEVAYYEEIGVKNVIYKPFDPGDLIHQIEGYFE